MTEPTSKRLKARFVGWLIGFFLAHLEGPSHVDSERSLALIVGNARCITGEVSKSEQNKFGERISVAQRKDDLPSSWYQSGYHVQYWHAAKSYLTSTSSSGMSSPIVSPVGASTGSWAFDATTARGIDH